MLPNGRGSDRTVKALPGVVTGFRAHGKSGLLRLDHDLVKGLVAWRIRGVIGEFERRTQLFADLAEAIRQALALPVEIRSTSLARDAFHHAGAVLIAGIQAAIPHLRIAY